MTGCKIYAGILILFYVHCVMLCGCTQKATTPPAASDAGKTAQQPAVPADNTVSAPPAATPIPPPAPPVDNTISSSSAGDSNTQQQPPEIEGEELRQAAIERAAKYRRQMDEETRLAKKKYIDNLLAEPDYNAKYRSASEKGLKEMLKATPGEDTTKLDNDQPMTDIEYKTARQKLGMMVKVREEAFGEIALGEAGKIYYAAATFRSEYVSCIAGRTG